MKALWFLPLLALPVVLGEPRAAEAGEPRVPFEGEVRAEFSREGGALMSVFYARKGSKLRLEEPDQDSGVPFNLLDLESGRLTVVFAHNASFVHLPPAARVRPVPGSAAMPARCPVWERFSLLLRRRASRKPPS